MRRAHNWRDLTGLTFHRLTVVELAGKSPKKSSLWRCRCECGNETVTATAKLTSGATKSCGCWSRDRITSHGLHDVPEYYVWQQMKERCNNPKRKSYQRYGARGITVCERWQESFANFYADMGPRPEGTSLDRIDNNGPYSPENCRWADNFTQCRNRRATVWIEFRGETKCRKDWATQFGVDVATLAQRLARGWTMERAVTTPPMNSGGGRRRP